MALGDLMPDPFSFVSAARRSQKKISGIERRLTELAGLFGDIDQCVDGLCDDVRVKLDELRQYISETATEHKERQHEERMAERQCPHCNLIIRGPVYHRHVKRCPGKDQPDMATRWGEDRRLPPRKKKVGAALGHPSQP